MSLPAGPAAGDELRPWNGPTVATLSRELQARVVAAEETASRTLPQGNMDQRVRRDATVSRLSALRERVEALEAKLAVTQSPDQSKPLFDEVAVHMAEVRAYLDRSKRPRRLEAAWDLVERSFRRIAPYYGVEAVSGG